LLPQDRSADVAEIKASICKTPQCRKADHHILNFHRFEKPITHSHFLLFTAGIGYGQVFATAMVLFYYCALLALTAFYLVQSFAAELPWSRCFDEWENCFDAGRTGVNSSNETGLTNQQSSSELFF